DGLELFTIDFARSRRAAKHHAGDEAAEDRVDADGLRDYGTAERDHNHDRQRRMLDHRVIVNPSYDQRYQPKADEVAEENERAGESQDDHQPVQVDPAASCQSRHNRKQQPSHAVVENAGGENQKSQLASQQVEVDQN